MLPGFKLQICSGKEATERAVGGGTAGLRQRALAAQRTVGTPDEPSGTLEGRVLMMKADSDDHYASKTRIRFPISGPGLARAVTPLLKGIGVSSFALLCTY